MTGTDEHGEKIAEAAAAQGLRPQEHCDSVVQQYKDLWAQVRLDVQLIRPDGNATQARAGSQFDFTHGH